MDYKAHYDKLIARGQRTLIHGYRERHHIVPKCLGGDDSEDNLVYLTAEEHYIAHQLLVKIYPSNQELIYAANMMCVKDGNQQRNNKEYGWLKQRRSELMKIKMQGNSYAKGAVRSEEFKANLSKQKAGVKKAPRTQEHTDNWRKSRMRNKGTK